MWPYSLFREAVIDIFISQLSDDQLYQLHELLTVTKELFDPERAQSQPPGGAKSVNDAVNDALERAEASMSSNGKGGKGE
jgi:hypothetical protein